MLRLASHRDGIPYDVRCHSWGGSLFQNFSLLHSLWSLLFNNARWNVSSPHLKGSISSCYLIRFPPLVMYMGGSHSVVLKTNPVNNTFEDTLLNNRGPVIPDRSSWHSYINIYTILELSDCIHHDIIFYRMDLFNDTTHILNDLAVPYTNMIINHAETRVLGYQKLKLSISLLLLATDHGLVSAYTLLTFPNSYRDLDRRR